MPVSQAVITAIKQALDDASRKRAEVVAPYDKVIAEYKSFLEENDAVGLSLASAASATADSEPSSMLTRRALNKKAVDHCADLLGLVGGHMTSAELNNAVVAAGIELQAADPAGRLVQLLSSDGRFLSDRRLGWSLKTAASSADVDDPQESLA